MLQTCVATATAASVGVACRGAARHLGAAPALIALRGGRAAPRLLSSVARGAAWRVRHGDARRGLGGLAVSPLSFNPSLPSSTIAPARASGRNVPAAHLTSTRPFASIDAPTRWHAGAGAGAPGASITTTRAAGFHTSAPALQNNKQGGQGNAWVNPENVPIGEHLKQFGTDLTALAEERKLDPVVGRHDEIRRTIQILCRRSKNNPVLIGEPGVGKTAIADGLAQRIVSKDVPETIQGKRVVVLDLAAMVAGASMHGQFEERLKGVLKDVEASNGEVILFIDEMHMLMGAGASSGMSAANMIKPALARGGLHCVGATTLKEYRQYIEKDAALARRFQPVMVPEPDVEDTVTILRGLKEKYEVHHGVRIRDSALVAAARMAQRYIPERKMPDKAIDIMDEAASRLRLQQESKPEPIWKLSRLIATKRIEMAALQRENDEPSKQRLKELSVDVEALEAEHAALTAEWEAEKAALNAVKNAKEELEAARTELDRAQEAGNYDRAGELLHSRIPKLEKRISEAKEEERRRKKAGEEGKTMLEESVTPRTIAEVVARSTGIPVDNLLHGEKAKLLNMEAHLQKRVKGQPEAIAAVSDCLRLARAGLHSHKRPLGVFLFLGPTGVGKTALTKSVADFMFNDEAAMTRIDMSEYMEKHNVSRLVGAPPGYVGYEEGGTLSDSVRRRPYQLVLFDEFEKAHRDVSNLLLQVLDEGALTDSQGFHVDFKNTVIILTSNLGSDVLAELPEGVPSNDPSVRERVMDEVRSRLSPEFLNRIDEIVMFNRLDREVMRDVVDVQLAQVRELLAEKETKLDIDEGAKQWLADAGFDPRYGARPLQRVIQRNLLNPMARMYLEGSLHDGDELIHVKVGSAAEAAAMSASGSSATVRGGADATAAAPGTALVIAANHAPDEAAFNAASESDVEIDEPGTTLLGSGEPFDVDGADEIEFADRDADK